MRTRRPHPPQALHGALVALLSCGGLVASVPSLARAEGSGAKPSATTVQMKDPPKKPAAKTKVAKPAKPKPAPKKKPPGAPTPPAPAPSTGKTGVASETDEDTDETSTSATSSSAAPSSSSSASTASSSSTSGDESDADDDSDGEEDSEDEDPDHPPSQPPITAGAEVDLNARFLWRGMAFSRGPVVQPSVWVSSYGLTALVWANAMINDELPDGKHLSSVVPEFTYTYRYHALTIEPGLFIYASPSEADAPTTSEASLDVSYGLGRFRLISGTKIDVKSHRGAYFGTFGGEYRHTVHRLTLRAFLAIGWATKAFNEAYFETSTAAFDVVEAGASLRYDLTRVFYLTLHTEAMTLLAHSLRSSVEEPTLVNGGLALGFEL